MSFKIAGANSPQLLDAQPFDVNILIVSNVIDGRSFEEKLTMVILYRGASNQQ